MNFRNQKEAVAIDVIRSVQTEPAFVPAVAKQHFDPVNAFVNLIRNIIGQIFIFILIVPESRRKISVRDLFLIQISLIQAKSADIESCRKRLFF